MCTWTVGGGLQRNLSGNYGRMTVEFGIYEDMGDRGKFCKRTVGVFIYE